MATVVNEPRMNIQPNSWLMSYKALEMASVVRRNAIKIISAIKISKMNFNALLIICLLYHIGDIKWKILNHIK